MRGKRIAKILYNRYTSYLCCTIPLRTPIGKELRLPHAQGIVISGYAKIGDFCTIYQNVAIGANEHRNNFQTAPQIGNNVYIGAGAVVIGDIEIGDNVIVGANATVTKSIPAGSIVVGMNKIIQGNIERNPHPHFAGK